MLESSVFPDHRTRVAAERRARMHRKLVESALLVFAEKGVDAPVIEDVIAAADVSRGTFYNYFRTNGELLAAAIQELGNELVEHIEQRVTTIPSPAERLFTGLRLYLGAARRFPLFARFVGRVGPEAIGTGSRVQDYIPIHLAEAVRAASSSMRRFPSRWTVVVGVGLVAVARIAQGRADDGYLSRDSARARARARARASRAPPFLSEPLAPLDLGANLLLIRTHARFKKQKRRIKG